MANQREATPRSGTETGSGRRLDIQGMRALAVVLVLLAHAKVPPFDGGFIGVDVFFLLSGFLITGLLLREVERSGTLSFVRFYARRARRLLPLAALVLLFIAIGSLLWLPVLQQIDVGREVIGAALYVVNWIFAGQQVDYFAATDNAISPVQHYWSLSVEEEFYLGWPLLMLTLTIVATRLGRRPRSVILAGMIPIALGSLAYSIFLTGSDPELAYFSTFTRIWELAFGAILVISAPHVIRMRPRLSDLMVGGGLLIILASALLITDETPFPGWQAVAPVLGAVLVLVGGAAPEPGRVVRLLLFRPVQHVGNISYAWYLWHWPFIVFASAIWPGIGTLGLVAVVAASLIPTEVSHWLVEKPIHTSKRLARMPKRALAIGATCSLAAAVVGVTFATGGPDVKVASDVPGARVIKDGRVPLQRTAATLAPAPVDATADRGRAFADGCLVWGSVEESGSCTYGDPDSETSVVLFGDSRALQYFAALEPIAVERGWKLVVLTRGDCLVAEVKLNRPCDQWRETTLRRIEDQEHPDLVVVGTANKYFWALGAPESLPMLTEGMARTLERLRGTGAKVVVMRDQSAAPFRPPETPGDCVASNLHDLSKCAWRPAKREGHAFELLAAARVGVPTIDTQKHVCRAKLCPLVIGNAIAYKDGYHYSATFMKTLAPWLERQLPRVAAPAASVQASQGGTSPELRRAGTFG